MAMGEQAVGESPEELLSISTLEDGKGLEIVDHIERRHVSVLTPQPIEIFEGDPEVFDFPVRRAVTFETDQLFLSNRLGIIVRNSLGFIVSEVTKGNSTAFPKDEYSLDPGAPIKLYLKFDAAFDVKVSEDGIRINFGSPRAIHLGARSHHKQPATTITTTSGVEDVMEAVSYFSSALKTTSCERSYPTLRGHPPTLKMGDELSIPSFLNQPDTGIRIELPRDIGSVFACSSLAYYLGATLVPADDPMLVTNEGFNYPLAEGSHSLKEKVQRVIKQVFFLDCLTRTEGFFQINLHERNAVENSIGLDFSELYSQPIARQLESYLEIPYSHLSRHIPRWKLVSHVPPDSAHLETLPFLVNDLSIIKIIDGGNPEGLMKGGSSEDLQVHKTGNRSIVKSTNDQAPTPRTVNVRQEESIEQAWLGDGAPLGVSKAMVEAFNNRLGRTPADNDIDITVICNAEEMGQERDIVDEVYASRNELPFDVSIHRKLTTAEMRSVLQEDTDFLHYIGHIDSGGFECTDGRLDVSKLDHTGVDIFFLNACSSYEQGMNLIRAGSIAGVVTLEDVINSGAERVGLTLARLLNWGFPLRPAMNIARNESIMGGHYLVIGDGGVDIAQPPTGIQGLCKVNKRGTNWGLRFTSFPAQNKGLGSIIALHLKTCEEFYLISSTTEEFILETQELIDFLSVEEMPIQYDNELTWSREFLQKIG